MLEVTSGYIEILEMIGDRPHKQAHRRKVVREGVTVIYGSISYQIRI